MSRDVANTITTLINELRSWALDDIIPVDAADVMSKAAEELKSLCGELNEAWDELDGCAAHREWKRPRIVAEQIKAGE